MAGALPLVLALLAVMALVGLAFALGFNARPVLADHAAAAELASALPGGFHPVEICLASDGAGALLRDTHGRIALIAPLGAHFAARLYETDWRVARGRDGEVLVRGADFSCRIAMPRLGPGWAAFA